MPPSEVIDAAILNCRNLMPNTRYMASGEPHRTEPNLRASTLHQALAFSGSRLLELIAAGAPWEEILEDYPFLEVDDIKAAVMYAALRTNFAVAHVAAA